MVLTAGNAWSAPRRRRVRCCDTARPNGNELPPGSGIPEESLAESAACRPDLALSATPRTKRCNYSYPHNLASPGRDRDPCPTQCYLRPQECSCQMASHSASSSFSGCPRVADVQTAAQTDRQTLRSVAIAGMPPNDKSWKIMRRRLICARSH